MNELFAKPDIHETVTVKRDGPSIAMFLLTWDGQATIRKLVNEQGEECDSVGGPLAKDMVKAKKGKKNQRRIGCAIRK